VVCDGQVLDVGFNQVATTEDATARAQQLKRAVAFIIKWNQRGTPLETLAKAKVAEASTVWSTLREGKRECVWVDAVHVHHVLAVVSKRANLAVRPRFDAGDAGDLGVPR